MPRNVSLSAMQAALAQETSKVFLVLLEVKHVDLPESIRLVNNTTNIVSEGHTYTAFPFHVTMPDDRDDREPVAEVSVANVTRELIDEIRNIHDTLHVVLRVVLADTPSTIEWGPVEMEVQSIRYDATVITFSLGMQAFTHEPFPYKAFTPNKFPGLFKR
jgi:hypothetical protein